MRVTRRDVEEAVGGLGLDRAVADGLWAALEARTAHERRFDGVHVLYYAGALVVIGSMAWLLGPRWEDLGGGAIAAIALGYAALYFAVGRALWRRGPATRTPGGLWIAMAVSMTPLVAYGLQRATGLWGFDDPGRYEDFYEWIRGGWFLMEVATIAVGTAALRAYRFPFLVAPVAVALWFMSMDLTPILYGGAEFSWEARKTVSVLFGLVMLGVAYAVDLRQEADLAFWLYLFGLMAFWGGLSALDSDDEVSRLAYALINVVLLALAVFLRRRAFAVFGAVGLLIYLGHLAYDLFPDAVLFPVVLSAVGMLVVLAGVWLQRRSAGLERWLDGTLPPSAARLRPRPR